MPKRSESGTKWVREVAEEATLYLGWPWDEDKSDKCRRDWKAVIPAGATNIG